MGRIGLRRIDDDPYRVLDVLIDADSWDGTPPTDTVVTLEPGLYEFATSVNSTTGDCSSCEVESNSSMKATLTVE